MLAPRAGRFLAPVATLLALDLLLVAWFGVHHAFLEIGVAVVLAGLLSFFAIFFRDPRRAIGDGIVSAADGRVRAVERIGDRWLISVFMNVTNVHVNRFPTDATVDGIEPSGAGYRPAYVPQAEGNVQRRYRLSTPIGAVDVVQITGIVARRLVSFVDAGSVHHKGDKLGMIVLGSRVDVLLPFDRVVPTVTVGNRVRAGATTIARIAT